MTAGFVSVGLGAVGVFVPLLPTTPFLLLAAACFIRGSDSYYQWLINHKWLGAYIRNYREHKAITLQAKTISLASLWLVIGYSATYVASSWWLRGFLGIVAVGVTVHLLHLKTLTAEMMAQSVRLAEPAKPVETEDSFDLPN
ncbi:MAG: YbaN family protein [candidate division Zixibacteria bacterium]|nr:YbaN family protein [candidate division Zixibacteria bacterium]